MNPSIVARPRQLTSIGSGGDSTLEAREQVSEGGTCSSSFVHLSTRGFRGKCIQTLKASWH